MSIERCSLRSNQSRQFSAVSSWQQLGVGSVVNWCDKAGQVNRRTDNTRNDIGEDLLADKDPHSAAGMVNTEHHLSSSVCQDEMPVLPHCSQVTLACCGLHSSQFTVQSFSCRHALVRVDIR